MDGGAWWAAVHRVAQSWTRLKRVSMPVCIGEGNGKPFQYSCLENPRDRRAWWVAVYGVPQNWTRLRQLSSSSSRHFSEEDIWMAYRHIQWCSTILIMLVKIQIKSTVKCHLHLSEWPSLKCLQRTNGQEGVEKMEPSYTVDGHVNWWTHFGKQYGGCLKN